MADKYDFAGMMQALAICVAEHGEEGKLVLPLSSLHNLDPTGTMSVNVNRETGCIEVEFRGGPKSQRTDESIAVIMGD